MSTADFTPVLIYITAPTPEEAKKLGRGLVEQRLAACANVIPGMTPIFWWEGEVQEDSEAVLIAKTRSDLVDAVTEHVSKNHSYRCPCTVAVPITGGNEEFISWIAAETRA